MYIIENAVLTNSLTFKVGDAVLINTAAPQFITNAAGGTGIILGTILTLKSGVAGGNIPLQTTSVTTSATNQTVEGISADVLASQNICTMIADLDAAAGTTTNSQYFGYFNLHGSISGQLSEASYSASAEKQFLSYGVVPGNSSQVFGVWTKIAQA